MNPYVPFLPTPENQYNPSNPSIDWFDCTDFSCQNYFETKLNRLIGEKIISLENVKWLNDNGYFDKYGSLNFSDQFNGILSGNVGKGNSYENVIASVLRDGLIPDAMFQDNPQTVAQYYDKTLITQSMLNMGQEFLKHFKIEVVTKSATLDDLRNDLLWMTINVCGDYSTAPIIGACVLPPTHSVLGYDIAPNYVSFFDSYPAYRKKTVPSNVYAKWILNINEINNMYKLIASANPNYPEVYAVKPNGEVKQIGDYNTLLEGNGIEWDISQKQIVDDEEYLKFKHDKSGLIIITRST